MKLRKLFAGVAAAATLLGGMAFGATAANAVPGDASTITLNGNVAGRTFTAYPLGAYTNVEGTAPTATSLEFTENTEWAPSLAAIAATAGITVPAEYTGNTLAYVSTLNQTTDGAKLRAFAQGLAAATTKPANPTVFTAAGDATQAVLDVPADGWYLVTDSDGAPILVGTQTADKGGNVFTKLNDTTLGSANVKPNTPDQPKKEVNENQGSVYVGQTLSYTVTAKVPNTTGYDTYQYYLKDVASKGLTVNDDFVVTLGDETLTKDRDYTVTSTVDSETKVTTTLVTLNNVAGKDGKDIVVKYTATVNSEAVDSVTNTASVSKDNTTWTDGTPVTKNLYKFQISKFQADGKTPLAGAEFTITNAPEGYAGSKALTTDANGVVTFTGLREGDYTVKETKVPAGYLQNVRPEFTVNISDKGVVTLKAKDSFGLATKGDGIVINVKNVKSVTQLPLTGAAGTMLFTVVALLIAGVAATVFAKSRSTKRALNA